MNAEKIPKLGFFVLNANILGYDLSIEKITFHAKVQLSSTFA